MGSEHGRGRLILIRHGESEGNRDRTFTLTPEVPLTELGHEQALATGEHIRTHFRPARIVASPYRRAQQTAEGIARHIGLTVETEPDIRERDFGVFVGKPYESVFAEPGFNSVRRWEWQPEGGESLLAVQARTVPAVLRIAAENPGVDVVVVSHGGVMMALSAHFAGTWDGVVVPRNCGIILVEHGAGAFGPPQVFDFDS